MSRREALQWAKDHRKELIVVGITMAGAIGIVLVLKNPKALALLKSRLRGVIKKPSKKQVKVASKIFKETVKNQPPKSTNNAIDFEKAATELKGNRLTATELGKKVNNVSAKEINDRLVKAGLAERLPNGELYATEIGRKFGEGITRTQPWGYDAYVYGWDEKVLDLIFTEAEMAESARRKAQVAKIMAEMAEEAV